MDDAVGYELAFPPESGSDDVVLVRPTGATGPSGSPIYSDESGIIAVEINERCEVRMLATGAYQRPRRPVRCRPIASR